MTESTAVVVGYGSIGDRHARVLAGLDQRVAVVSRRPVEVARAYRNLGAALAGERPGYVVIATEAARHGDDLGALAALGFTGRVLVEKPLLAAPAPLPVHRFESLHVGYNLRFHPLLQRVRALLAGGAALSADVYVGQYLPEWRPGRDHRTTASAARGSGGVLRDLSHELDYLTWLLGPCRRLAGLGGRFAPLEIDSEDGFGLLIEAERCPLITLHMNYHDRIGARRVVINTAEQTLHADLVAGTLTTDTSHEDHSVDRDHTYRAMHRAVLAGGDPALCDSAAGLAVVDLVAAAERAAAGGWVER